MPVDVDLEAAEAAFRFPELNGDLLVTRFGGVGLGTMYLSSAGQIGDGQMFFQAGIQLRAGRDFSEPRDQRDRRARTRSRLALDRLHHGAAHAF